MKTLFLIGPFFIYLGIAAQNFGLILSGMLAPLLFFNWGNIEQIKRFRNLGMLLLGAWGLWPLCNLIAAFLLQRRTLFDPPFDLLGPLSIASNADITGQWLSSQLPSSVGISGLVLILASFCKTPKTILVNSEPLESGITQSNASLIDLAVHYDSPASENKAQVGVGNQSQRKSDEKASYLALNQRNGDKIDQFKEQSSPKIIETWIKLLFFSCLIFGVYFAIQHATGFDFRKSQRYLPNMQFPGGTYRIQGFSGHPLTIAGISLCLVGFSSWMMVYFREKSSKLLGYTTGILLLNMFFLYASGGRTGFFIGVLWLGIIGTYLASKFMKPKTLIFSWVVIILLLFMVLSMSGIGERYLEAFEINESGKLPNRVVFWKVHWQMFLDSPWVGQGYGHLSKGLRLMYYDAMGYREFEERFNAHNMILETLSNIGIIGTFVLLSIGYQIILIGKEIAKSNPLSNNLGKALLIAVALNFFHGITQNVFYDSGVMVVYMNLFWLFVWSALALNKTSSQRLV